LSSSTDCSGLISGMSVMRYPNFSFISSTVPVRSGVMQLVMMWQRRCR
jgi:hypothetical protein